MSNCVVHGIEEPGERTAIGKAAAGRLCLRARREAGRVVLEIEDDGRGIGAEEIAKPRSLGLKGMRERFTYLGGSFEVGRAPRGGTRVRVSVAAKPA